MKITFEKKKNENDHLVFIYKDKLSLNQHVLSTEQKNIVKNSNITFKGRKEFTETIHYNAKAGINSLTLAKIHSETSDDQNYRLESFGGKLLSYLEKKKF